VISVASHPSLQGMSRDVRWQNVKKLLISFNSPVVLINFL